MKNQATSDITSQHNHKKKWEKPTIEIINGYDIESGNILYGSEGVQFPGTPNTFWKYQETYS